jgi:hypothetical protein
MQLVVGAKVPTMTLLSTCTSNNMSGLSVHFDTAMVQDEAPQTLDQSFVF